MPKDSSKPVPRSKTHSRVQFITTPTADTPGTALLLHFDDRRYLIGNIHEGLQRAGLQVGAKVFRAKDFFLTGKTEWRSNGGLMGMILTLADSNNARAASRTEVAKIKLERRVARSREEEQQENSKKSRKKNRQGADQTSVQDIEPQVEEEDPTITLHGGPNLSHTIATARSFIFRHGNPLKVDEYSGEDIPKGEVRDWEPTWQDEWVRVWSMAISPSTSEGSSRPVSPRKRSLGEYINGQIDAPAQPGDTSSPIPIPNVDEKQRNQKIRDFVVTEMFNSSWRYDNLVEKPLHEVVMPANLFTKDPKTKKLVKYTGPVPDGTTPVPNVKVLVRQPWPGALVDHLPPTKPSPIAMSYIFRNHPQRGKFRPEAAKALKVPSGPLWAALAKGNEVKSSDGKTITPDMVLQPGKEGSGIAVIDLPSEDYLQNLVRRPEWKAERVMNGVGAVVWLLGPGLAHNPVLREFIDSKSDIKHMISSVDTCPNYLVQTAAASAAIRHNQIDPARFPIPVHSNATALKLVESGDNEEHKPEHLLSAQRGLQIDLEPSFKITDQNIIPHLNTALVLQETPKQVLKLAQAAREDIKSKTAQVEAANQGLPSEDAEITSLGTGSASPSIFRNVSATLLRVPGHGSYLIDCGENTLGQLKRVFTESQLAEVFHDLKMIWISHLHADHHLGIASVVRAWYEEVHGKDSAKRSLPSRTEALSDPARFLEEGKKLFIVGHSHMMRWLEEYSSVEDFGYNQLVPCSTFSTNWQQPDRCNIDWNGINIGFNTAKDPNVRSAMRKATSLSNLVTTPVSHCYGAQAVSLTFPNGFKFSYSGDCRPSNKFAIIGKGSTVLLHEATFDDELIGDAEAKKHSTTSEAIGVGMAMGARRLILTHFSQRYQKIPSMGSMKSLNVRLEDAEDVEDEMAAMEPPDNVENEPPVETGEFPKRANGNLNSELTQIKTENGDGPQPPKPSNDGSVKPANDMKIGVAFDYMRVKVGDIMHLEKFTPAMRELYKDAEREEQDTKAKKVARQAFSDDVKEVPATRESALEQQRVARDDGASLEKVGTLTKNEKDKAKFENKMKERERRKVQQL